MSTQVEILEVHTEETKFKLKPHLVKAQWSQPLRVPLAELFGPELIAKLREMDLLP